MSLFYLLVILGYSLTTLFLVTLKILDRYSNNIFFCDKFEWHREPKEIKNIKQVSCNVQVGKCPRCGKDVRKHLGRFGHYWNEI